MTRDHRKLKVFELAHQLTLAIYRESQAFPMEERYGLQSQLRRGAVSVSANIVEGSARRGAAEYLHFLNVSLGSAAEVDYLADLSFDLGFLEPNSHQRIKGITQHLLPALTGLVQAIECDVPSKSLKPRA